MAALVRFERTHRLPCLTDFKSGPFNRLGTAPYKKPPAQHKTSGWIPWLFSASPYLSITNEPGMMTRLMMQMKRREPSMAHPFWFLKNYSIPSATCKWKRTIRVWWSNLRKRPTAVRKEQTGTPLSRPRCVVRAASADWGHNRKTERYQTHF